MAGSAATDKHPRRVASKNYRGRASLAGLTAPTSNCPRKIRRPSVGIGGDRGRQHNQRLSVLTRTELSNHSTHGSPLTSALSPARLSAAASISLQLEGCRAIE